MTGIDYAKTLVGLQEVRDNKKLRALFKEHSVNRDLDIDPANIPWWSAFMNACERATGAKGTGLLNARSWLNYGVKVVGIKNAHRGDLLIFSRGGSSWQGHITYFDGLESDGLIRCLGGNQGDAVSYSFYPQSRLLGIRRRA